MSNRCNECGKTAKKLYSAIDSEELDAVLAFSWTCSDCLKEPPIVAKFKADLPKVRELLKKNTPCK